MYLLDTNIFLEYLLDQKQGQSCRQLIASLNSGREGFITSFSLHAIEAIMSRVKEHRLLTQFLTFIAEHPYLNIYTTSLDEEHEVSLIPQKLGLDFDDALQYFVAKKLKLKLVTLDRDFRKVKDIEVLSPPQP